MHHMLLLKPLIGQFFTLITYTKKKASWKKQNEQNYI